MTCCLEAAAATCDAVQRCATAWHAAATESQSGASVACDAAITKLSTSTFPTPSPWSHPKLAPKMKKSAPLQHRSANHKTAAVACYHSLNRVSFPTNWVGRALLHIVFEPPVLQPSYCYLPASSALRIATPYAVCNPRAIVIAGLKQQGHWQGRLTHGPNKV